MFTKSYGEVFEGDERWNSLEVPEGDRFEWDPESTYVRKPPFFDDLSPEPSPLEDVEGAHAEASETLERIFPEEWKESNDEADFDLIDISLDQMEAAVSASEREQAEQARLSAYAFFEFGPEIKLRAFDPALVTKVEGLMWYGAEGADGLAELISNDRPVSEIRETRLVLDEALNEARARAAVVLAAERLGTVKAFRDFAPGQRVQARIEVSGRRLLRGPEAGIDVMGDGTLVPYAGAVRRRRLEASTLDEAIAAIRAELDG
jgi:hypothetical protein